VASLLKPLPFAGFLTRNNRAMEKKEKTKKPPTTTVRLPPDLHAEVKQAAAQAAHSMNDEIILRLQAHSQALALGDIAQQNVELQRMLQRLIDRLC
jgi:hypothetical protein